MPDPNAIGKEPETLRPTVARSREPSGDLRQRLERLDGLPLRPATVRRWLLAEVAGRPTDPEIDPGFVLGAVRGPQPIEPLDLAAARPWWPTLKGPEADARERLWRHALAARLAARRLAIELGSDRPDDLARAAFLHGLGLWAVAAVAPARLADLLAIDDPARRREAGRDWFGAEPATLGRDLAERWGCPPLVAEAAWLHAGHDRGLRACADDPEALALIQAAHAWAERTPWALGPGPWAAIRPSDPRLKLLVAEVQVLCGAPLADPDATAPEEQLAREHAELLRRVDRLEREAEANRRFLDAIARSGSVAWPGLDIEPPPADAAQAAAEAWKAQLAARGRQARRLDAAVAAHRSRSESEDHDRRAARLEALAEFAAGAGHELNNPLAVIVGRAQLLLGRLADDADAGRSLRAILGQAQRAHRILRDLMYIARPPAPRPRPCQPGEIVRACLRDLQGEAERRGVRLTAEIAEPSAWAWADPDPLRHLADVLVRNALEATPSGGQVGVNAELDPRRLRWTVVDDGRGIDPGEARRLLDPFYCGRQAGRGLGLGLPRAARYVALAGGSLDWQSAAGRGATFRVTIPLDPIPEAVGSNPLPAA